MRRRAGRLRNNTAWRGALLATALALPGAGLAAPAPVHARAVAAAQPPATVMDGNARFEVLTPTLVRMEYATDGKFQDGSTINVVNRDFPVPAYSTYVQDGWRIIKTDKVTLRYQEGSGPFSPANTEVDLMAGSSPVTAHPAWSNPPCEFGQVCQAEYGQLSGGASVATDHSGYTGTGFAAGYQNTGASDSYVVNDVPATGDYTLAIREANYPASSADGGACMPRTLSEYVNGTDVGTVTLPATASWDDWTTVTTTVHLAAGQDTLALARDPDDCGNVNVDYVSLSAAGQPLPQPQPAPASHNLGGWYRSLDGRSGPVALHDGLLSTDGWYLLDDSQTPLWTADGWAQPRPRHSGSYQDGYLLGYGHDYKTALSEFAQLTGPAPLLPEWAFGNWYSRYYPYRASDYTGSLVPAFRQHNVPLDVLVIDTDWKNPSTWNGWNWNPALFPDPAAFLSWAHQQGLHTTLNIHSSIQGDDPQFPAANQLAGGLIPNGGNNYVWDWSNPQQAASYFSLHQPFEKQGVDFWWLDWCCDSSRASMAGITPDTWINYLYAKDLTDKGKRGFAFSRMGSSLQNWDGSYPEGPWAEHRYDVHFTGDTYATWDMLSFEDYFTIREGNIGLPYVTHDIGSFNGPPPGGPHDPDDLYARWVQLGAFQPVLRLHSNHGDRLPWSYGPAAEASAEDAMRLHEALIPYSYTAAREAYDSGVPMVRGMYLDYPDTPAAYSFGHEYMYGDNMLVAPVTTAGNVAPAKVWFPPGTWVDYFTGAQYQGPSVQTITEPLDRMPVFVKAGAIVPEQSSQDYLGQNPGAAEILKVYPGGDGSYRLYNDAGEGLGYQRGAYTWTPVSHTSNGNGEEVVTIGAAQGSFPGQPASRTFDVQAVDASQPASVRVNNTELPHVADGASGPGWWYDAGAHVVHVGLPPQAARDSVTVALEGTHQVQVPPPPVVGVSLQAGAMTAGSASTVSATVTNYGPGTASNVTAKLPAPAGWTVTPAAPASVGSLAAGAWKKVTWQVTPGQLTGPITQQQLQATAAYAWGDGAQQGSASDAATVYVSSPVQAPFKTYASTSPAYFGQQAGNLAVATDGADTWTGNDEYGAVYQPAGAGDTSTAVVKVGRQDNTSDWAKAGLMMRDDMTKAGGSPGYAMIAVTPGNGVAFQWDGDGNGYLDGNVNTGTGTAAAPIWLKLVRSGSQFTGYYSTDGTTWTQVASATVPGAASAEDAGVFLTSHAPGTIGEADFSGFQVSPAPAAPATARNARP